jgi:uncharacterized protein YegP (UPF0339 family)
MSDDSLPEEWRILRNWLSDDLALSAQQFGFVKRSTGRVDAEMWLRLILMHVAGGLSLKQTMLRAAELEWCELSHVALFKRLRVAHGWLSGLCGGLLEWQRKRIGEPHAWPEGWNVRLIDATNVQEPGNTGTLWRIHYSMSMPSMVCDHYEITDEKGGEKFGRFKFSQGEFVVADRGYSHRAGVAHVIDSGAEALVRWNPASFPLETSNGKVDDMLRWLRKLPPTVASERNVQFRHEGRIYPLRLCAIRKSQLATEAARKKAREKAKRKGNEIQPETLEYAEYVMVLCSANRQTVSVEEALYLYRGRWQVELVFKRLKSLLQAGHVPKESDQSARAWMQAKILSALLIERTLWEGEFLSPWGYGLGRGRTSEPLAIVH